MMKNQKTKKSVIEINKIELSMDNFCVANDCVQSQIEDKADGFVDLKRAAITGLNMHVTIEFKKSLAPLFDLLRELKDVELLEQKHCAGQSVSWENGREAICFYNKTLMVDDYILSPGYKNALSINYRIMTQDAIEDILETTEINELTQDEIDEVFLNAVEMIIDRLGSKLCLTTNDILDIFKEQKDRDKFLNFINKTKAFEPLKRLGENDISGVAKKVLNCESTYKWITENFDESSRELSTYKDIVSKIRLVDAIESNLLDNKGKISNATGSLLCN